MSASTLSARPGSALRSGLREVADWLAVAPALPGSLVPHSNLRRLDPAQPPVVRSLQRNLPVVFVHGYGGNIATWTTLAGRLHHRGLIGLHTFGYASYGVDVPLLARRLVEQIRRDIGSGPVHLVGHSLGGLIVRYAVTELGLDRQAVSVTTIATPHSGSALARLCRNALGRDLRPRSGVVRRLSDGRLSACVRWTAYRTDRDLLVTPASAVLPGSAVDNVLVPGYGHVSVLNAPVLADDLAARLRLAELATAALGRPPETTAQRDAPLQRAKVAADM
ncbi:MAG: triacylglycerol lipase [Frankiaceae bacterium]|jgi:pimeloyl-ACP methyl ester carboxylesterase|nr:triacylglycerol lipase [Frankiaceae bacterium]